MNEIRSVPTDLKIITRDDGSNSRTVQGYAILFNTMSCDLGGFTEVIKPESLDGVDLSDVALVYAHDNNSILARSSAGNLTTQVDDTGLFFSAKLPETTLANDVLANVEAGNLKGMSFAFTIPDGGDEWTRQQDGSLLHTVNQIGIISELTITAYPAYTETSIELKRSLKNIEKRDEMAEKNDKPEEVESTEIDPAQLLEQIKALQEAVATLTEDDSEDDNSEDTPTETKDAPENDKDDQQERDEDDDDLERSAENKEVQKRSTIQNEKDNTEMTQVITRDNLTEDQKVKRSYIEALKDVNKRDGVTVDTEGNILVPKQVLDVAKVPNDPATLAHYINRAVVTAPTGTLPVLAKASARLATKAELQKNSELAKASITGVDYKVQTYIGQLPISAEMLQDYPEAESLVAQYLQDVKSATEEEAIGSVLSTKFGSNTAESLDDLKSAFNKLVTYGSDRVVVMSVSAFDAIDQLKDGEGRYYLQPSVTAPSGSTIFGANIIIVADTTFGKAGDANVFVGSLKHAVVEAVRLDGLATSWAQNDYFEQVLSVATRFDVKQADELAGSFFKFAPSAQTNSGAGQ